MLLGLVIEVSAYRHTGPQPVLQGDGCTLGMEEPLGVFIFSWSYSWEAFPGWSVGRAELMMGGLWFVSGYWTLIHPSLFSWVLSV